MKEIVVKCGQCGADVPLTDSLAAPLIEATKKEYERRLAQKDGQLETQRQEMESRRKDLEEAEAAIDDTISRGIEAKSNELSQAEAKKARAAVQSEMEAQKLELEEAKALIESRTTALTAAKKAEAEFMKAKRALDDERIAMDVTIQEKVDQELQSSKQSLRTEIEGEVGKKLRDKDLEIREKDLKVESMKIEIENLRRKSEQGSQQLQGEVMERELKDVLASKFPQDNFSRVPKGVSGGDCVQEVVNSQGKVCGTILWESKRTRDWGKDWLKKVKGDQGDVKADTAAIVSTVLPKDLANFDQIEGVWVTGWDCLVPVTSALRHLIIEVAATKRVSEGHKDKAALIYEYVTSNGFRQRVRSLVDTFAAMQQDLKQEQRAITKQWAKREAQLDQMVEATTGLYGDMQGIAGRSVPELEGLGFDALEAGDRSDGPAQGTPI
jgi:hypothetical protein